MDVLSELSLDKSLLLALIVFIVLLVDCLQLSNYIVHFAPRRLICVWVAIFSPEVE